MIKKVNSMLIKHKRWKQYERWFSILCKGKRTFLDSIDRTKCALVPIDIQNHCIGSGAILALKYVNKDSYEHLMKYAKELV